MVKTNSCADTGGTEDLEFLQNHIPRELSFDFYGYSLKDPSCKAVFIWYEWNSLNVKAFSLGVFVKNN